MLASCTSQPADAEGADPEGEKPAGQIAIAYSANNNQANSMSIHSESVGGVNVAVSSNFENMLTVHIRNASDRVQYLPPNFGATSRLTFYNRAGRLIESGGFEGRPEQVYRQIDPGGLIDLRYGNAMFMNDAIRNSHQICFKAQISTSQRPGAVESRLVCLVNSR